MICAYCKEDKDITKEHIISSSILDLCPECDLTYDTARGKHYKADPLIKDVCADCNNVKLTYLDAYAKSFVSKYFMVNLGQEDSLIFEYEYNKLLKVLLKYSYNDLRSHNMDVSFFDSESKGFHSKLARQNSELTYKHSCWTSCKHVTYARIHFWQSETTLGT